MILKEIDVYEYEQALNSIYNKNFLATPIIGKIREKKGYKTTYIGFYDDQKIVGIALLLSKKKLFNYYDYYAIRGPLINYNDDDTIIKVLTELKKYVISKNAFCLRIDPYVFDYSRDINGDRIFGFDNEKIIKILSNLGFKIQSSQEQVKTMFILDIENKNEEEILKDMKSNHRNCIKQAINNGIEIKELSRNELSLFKEIADKTSERRGYNQKPLSYYEDMYDYFSKDNQIKYLVANIDLQKLLDNIDLKIQTTKHNLNKLKNNPTKKATYEENIFNLQTRLEKTKLLIEKYGQKTITSAGMFIMYGEEIIYLISGNYKDLMSFYGQYLIQWEMIKYGLKNGYKKYNFYGIFGYKKGSENYGIYEFKRGFNGYVASLIGEQKLVLNSFVDKVYLFISKLNGIGKGN